MANKSFVFRFDDVEVREREFSLTKAGEVLPVEPKAFRVLLALLRNPGKLIGKEELLNAVWGDAAVTDNSLARSVALLRRLLGDETRNPRYIETVATGAKPAAGAGYSLRTSTFTIRSPRMLCVLLLLQPSQNTKSLLLEVRSGSPNFRLRTRRRL